MDDVVTLTPREIERLMLSINASIDVKKRSQFFLWVQGQLQSLLPHEVLICAHGDFARENLVFEHFSSFPIAEGDLSEVLNVHGGLVMQAIRTWVDRGEKPLVIAPGEPEAALFRRFESTLYRHQWGNLAVHGTPSYPGLAGSYFILGRLPKRLDAKYRYALEVMCPFIHSALIRMFSNERRETFEISPIERMITSREIEILQWVRDGKSNHEIGDILAISPLTVKNHVQKILKKLKVQNRAQAVARGISLQLIKSGLTK